MVACGFPSLGYGSECFLIPLAQARPLGLQPALELWRLPDVEAFQQVSAIELQCVGCSAAVHLPLECQRVAPDPIRVYTQAIAVASGEYLGADRAPEKVHCLIQGIPGVLGIVFRPEEGEEGVTPMGSTR
jgi:hypothetical protein